jgi:UDP-3-O-[3-hydroxymyristoyl] glucosamine N-acyltransferase
VALRLGFIVQALGGELFGPADLSVERIASLENASTHDISFLSSAKYAAQLGSSQAACVIVAPAMAQAAKARGHCIVTPDPYLYYAKLSQLWAREHARGAAQGHVHASAVIAPSAQVHPTARIGALCVVDDGAVIGAYTVLASRVTVGRGCTIGQRCVLHGGVVIGADGFGFAPYAVEGGKAWEKIEQLGSVRIGDDVEIGANTCIDRGALEDTVVEDGVKLDNLIQIGHNVHIGRHTAMAGCVGVAGSARIGAFCTVGGGAIVLGHLQVADNVHISAASVVTRSILKPGQYTGMFPIDDNASWEKNAVTLRQLHSLRERLRALEKLQKP